MRRTPVTPAYCYQAIFHHRTRNLNGKNISSQNGGSGGPTLRPRSTGVKHRLTPRALFHVRVVGRRGRSLQVRPRLRPRLPPLSRSHAVTDKDLRAKFISPPPYVF